MTEDKSASKTLESAFSKLRADLVRLKKDGGIALAFSGGLDSLVLLQLCLKEGLDVLALHFTGAHVAEQSSAQAVAWLQKHKIKHNVIKCSTLELPQVRHNHRHRCYFCKKHAFTALQKAADGLKLCDGTNASDLNGYRPGLEALRELNIYSPLAAAQINKAQVNLLADKFNLDKPAFSGQSCLLTRFDYGLEISDKLLNKIDVAEAELRALLHSGHSKTQLPGTDPVLDALPLSTDGTPLQFRLRYIKDSARPAGCRAELHVQSALPLAKSLQKNLGSVLAKHGLSNVPILAMPNISGYFDHNRE